MGARVLDDNALWRRCENAWAQWLESDGCAVTRLTDATSNTPHSGAPLITIGGRQRRAPDLLATRSGSSHYWEVKTRSRSEVDSLTGQRTHWMDHDAFRDYLTVSRSAQMRVWVVLYEALHRRQAQGDGSARTCDAWPRSVRSRSDEDPVARP